jgi:hypothetical protein
MNHRSAISFLHLAGEDVLVGPFMNDRPNPEYPMFPLRGDLVRFERVQ